MKLIIKQPIDKKEWATVFCVGTNACEIGGNLSNTVLEKMRSEGFIQKIDTAKLIHAHSQHSSLILDEAAHVYYEINKSIPDVPIASCDAVVSKKICDKCGGKIRRTHISTCPTNGLMYCEKCIDPEGKIYTDEYFRKK